MNRRAFMAFAASAALLAAGPAPAQSAAVVLTVNDAKSGRVVQFTDDDLMALPQRSFDTGTLWTKGVHSFSGPTLKSVLEAAGVASAELKLSAINNYSVSFPAEWIEDEVPIIANRIDGEPFPVREKGPLWLVFPYDSERRFKSEDVYSLSVWQLKQIDVLSE